MSCSISTLLFCYGGIFIHEQLSRYSSQPLFFLNLVCAAFILTTICALYLIFCRSAEKAELPACFFASSVALYTLMIGGLYINEHVLSGTLVRPDGVRILTNIGLLAGSIIFYMLAHPVFNLATARATALLKLISFKAAVSVIMLVLAAVGTLYAARFFYSAKPAVQLSQPPDDKPNVILITMDTTRADHLSCYGYHKRTTPHLDNWAKECAVFSNAYATSPWTLPSHASLFTALYPAMHGAHYSWEAMNSTNWPVSLAERHKTLAEILHDQGYRTAGVVGGFLCKAILGLNQGFEHYDDELIFITHDLEHYMLFRILNIWIPLNTVAARWGLDGSRIASQINDRVFPLLETYAGTPFFLFINYYDPHAPYLPPDEYYRLFSEDAGESVGKGAHDKNNDVACYDGEIAYLDYHLGQLFEKLKSLDIYDNTMIIVTADHGEFFGEHGLWFHSHELYNEVIQIPLMIKYPASSAKKGVYGKKVSLVDIMPTILNVLKIPLVENVQGNDLFSDTSRVIAEIYRHKDPAKEEGAPLVRELKALVLDNYKYIKEYPEAGNGHDELYDIDNDPQELSNLINLLPGKAEEMAQTLMDALSHNGMDHSENKQVEPDRRDVEALRALGYL